MYDANTPTDIDQAVIVAEAYFYGEDEERPGVILTPACDLKQQKADSVILCPLYPITYVIDAGLRSGHMRIVNPDGALPDRDALSNRQSGNLKDYVKALCTNRIPRYHFFAPFPGETEPLLGDFQRVTSLPIQEAEDLDPIVALRSPFREELPARYSSYVARVGTPDHTSADLDGWWVVVLDRLFPT